MVEEEHSISIKKFQEYLRIPSAHPNVDYEECTKFLKNYASELSLSIQIVPTCKNTKPIAIISWKGKDPELGSLVLISNIDVAHVSKDKWTRDPFGAEIDQKGNIYGCGIQDTKCIGIQYLEAIRRLKNNNQQLLRTVHLLFVPDGEIKNDGELASMKEFIETNEYAQLHVCFALDKGHASPNDHYLYFNGERTIWQFQINCSGLPGHGSALLENSAGQKVLHVLNDVYKFRDDEIKKLTENLELSLGDVTSINVTMLNGGVQVNVLPYFLTIVVDTRIAVTVDLEQFEKTLNTWCREAGDGISIKYTQKSSRLNVTHLVESNQYWLAFKKVLDSKNLKSEQRILPGSSDGRYLREVGVPVIGFSPIINTPILTQANDEYLNSKVFLDGIGVYYDIILEIANVPKDEYFV